MYILPQARYYPCNWSPRIDLSGLLTDALGWIKDIWATVSIMDSRPILWVDRRLYIELIQLTLLESSYGSMSSRVTRNIDRSSCWDSEPRQAERTRTNGDY